MIDINAVWYYTVVKLNDKNIPNSVIKSFNILADVRDIETKVFGSWKRGKTYNTFLFKISHQDLNQLVEAEKALADRIAFQIESQIFPKKHDIAVWLEQEMDRRQG